MKFLDVLRKLGILRYGTKAATYTGMQDRPAEFFMEGVFNAEKDLINQADVNNAMAAVKSLEGRKIMFWAVLPLGAFALLMFVAASGLTVWFGVDVLLWGGCHRGLAAVRLWGPLLLSHDDLPAGGPGFRLNAAVGGRRAGKISGAVSSPPLAKSPPPQSVVGQLISGRQPSIPGCALQKVFRGVLSRVRSARGRTPGSAPAINCLSDPTIESPATEPILSS